METNNCTEKKCGFQAFVVFFCPRWGFFSDFLP